MNGVTDSYLASGIHTQELKEIQESQIQQLNKNSSQVAEENSPSQGDDNR